MASAFALAWRSAGPRTDGPHGKCDPDLSRQFPDRLRFTETLVTSIVVHRKSPKHKAALAARTELETHTSEQVAVPESLAPAPAAMQLSDRWSGYASDDSNDDTISSIAYRRSYGIWD
ncbi:hypothetical protein B0H14DRAFT_3132182 [Mycena olivaceomarginata]|nr:hypothetical protein B0H14DRAFT_3132182 [Mycena olivaceomarginata]